MRLRNLLGYVLGLIALTEVCAQPELRVGAARMDTYLPLLKGKKIGLVVNHTSRVHQVHLVDTLWSLGYSIKAIFAPEHGFRGTADAGEKIEDVKTDYGYKISTRCT
jgi:uncharacterized protein YbbC (DUF1343 family)